MSRTPTKRRGPMGGHGGMGMSVEKAKDFKGTMKTLWSYLSNYKFAIIPGGGFRHWKHHLLYCRA